MLRPFHSDANPVLPKLHLALQYPGKPSVPRQPPAGPSVLSRSLPSPRRTPEPARSSPKSQPYAEITLPPHLPAPPFIRLITTLSGTVLSLNNFGELGPRARLGALVQPGGCAFTPDKATGVGHGAQRPPWVSNLFSKQRLNPTSIWGSPEFPQSFFALQRFSFPCPFAQPSLLPSGRLGAPGITPGLHADPGSLSPKSSLFSASLHALP